MDGDSTNKTFPVPLNHTARVAGGPATTSFVGDGLNTTFDSTDISYYGTIKNTGIERDVGTVHNDAQLLNYYTRFNGDFTGTTSTGVRTIPIDAARNHLRVPSSGRVVITPEQDLGVGYCSADTFFYRNYV